MAKESYSYSKSFACIMVNLAKQTEEILMELQTLEMKVIKITKVCVCVCVCVCGSGCTVMCPTAHITLSILSFVQTSAQCF